MLGLLRKQKKTLLNVKKAYVYIAKRSSKGMKISIRLYNTLYFFGCLVCMSCVGCERETTDNI